MTASGIIIIKNSFFKVQKEEIKNLFGHQAKEERKNAANVP